MGRYTGKNHTIIVGAGSSGCVLAARLSEKPDRSVLLLEAGPDYPDPAALPPEIRSGFNPAFTHDWGYDGETGSLGRTIALPRGRLVGGCSATNAAIALRGAPSDYDDWASRAIGAGVLPRNVVAGIRQSTALTDLAAACGSALKYAPV